MKYEIEGIEYPIVIRRKGNKNTYIRIKQGIIEVSTNYFTTKKQILFILEKNKESIQKMMIKCQQKQEKETKFYYLGKCYDIIKIPTDEVEIMQHTIYATDDKQLQKWYFKQLKTIYQERYQLQYQRFEENIPLYRLKVRKMKTRWGVCNRKSKTITLNTELLRYCYEAIDYVIIHELCHLIHFNHSKDFWNLVSKYCPNYKPIQKLLKET